MKVALLSDVHANLLALEAVLGALPPVDRIWVMGDTVGYGPDPADALALLRERGALLVAGNHDRAVSSGQGLELFNEAAAAAARVHQGWLGAAERDSLASLPEVATDGAFSLCHGSFRDPLWEYVFTAPVAGLSLARAATAYGCCGHTHVPALFRKTAAGIEAARAVEGETLDLGGAALVNPGSVGQPRDGDPRSSYAIVDTDAARVSFHRVGYDIAEVRRRIHARKLPDILGDRLVYGL